MHRDLRFAAALLLLVLALVGCRVVLSSRALLLAGRDELRSGNFARAVQKLGQAARMYMPGNPYSAGALDDLLQQARLAESRGDAQRARLAYAEVRSAVLATRGLYTPRRTALAEANAHLGRLTGIEARILERSEAPAVFFSVLALLGAAGLIASPWLLLRGRRRPGRVRFLVGAFVLSGVLFALGLYFG